MNERMIGIAAMGGSSNQVVQTIRDLEHRGISAAWLTMGGANSDAITLLAAAGVQTDYIKLGTSIVPTWPRHPVALVQQAQVMAQLTPGRFRLGIGPSHRTGMQRMFGASFDAPLANLREYLTIVKSLLQCGHVEFDGRHYHANASLESQGFDVPVMASALRRASFELCGEIADGAISWVCPAEYLYRVCLPALKRGAERAGRDAPPLIVHVPVCIHDDHAEGLAAVRDQLGRYAQIPFYQQMFDAAGFPEAASGLWSDGMSEAVAMLGTEEQVSDRLNGLFQMGAGEVLVSVVIAGQDPEGSRERTLQFLANID